MKQRVVTVSGCVLTLAGFAIGGSAASSAPVATQGETLFRQRCVACHAVNPPKQTPLAPSLAGVVGRKAGTTGFNYSPQLKKSGLVWTPAQLDRFLRAPAQVVPGTRMPIGTPNAAERSALIAYLATIK